MKVSDWMEKDVPTVTSSTSVTDVARMMTARQKSHVVVVKDVGRPIGVISAADLIAKHAQIHLPTYFSLLGYSVPLESRRDEREIEQALATTAAELMSTDIISIEPSADIDAAATMMLDNRVGFLPVIEDGHLVGVIDEPDIVRLLVVEEES